MKKLLLFGIVFLLLISSAAASNGIPVFHDPCDSNLGWQDNAGMTLTFTTTDPINVTSCKFTATDGKIMSYNTSSYLRNAPANLSTFNMSGRFRLDTTNDGSTYMGVTSSSTSCHWRDGAMMYINPSSSTWLSARALGGDINFIPKSLLQSGVTIMWEFNNTVSDSALEYNLYVDGVKNLTNVRLWKQSCNFTDLNGLGAFTVQLNANNIIYTDDLRVYNHSTGPPPAPPAPSTDTLNITSIVLPANYTQYNYNILNFNLSVNASNSFSAYLYLNNTLNQTRSFSSGNNVFVSFNATIPDGDHNFYINVTDPLSNDSEKTVNHVFYIDTINPIINWNSPAADNSSVILGNLTSNIAISDNNLFSYQYNLSWSNGSVIYSSTNTSLTGLTSATITDVIDLSSYIGTIRASLLLCDGHTSNNVSFDNVTVVDDELVVEDVDIYLINKADTQEINYEQQTDRYNFDFDTVVSSTTKEFYVESDSYIHILDGQTEYEGHLVMGDKWMDFESDNLKSVTITRINDYKVKVTVEKYSSTDVWEFESIGTLNCVTQYKKLFSITTSEAYNQLVLSGDSTTYQLNVTYNSSMGAVSGSLYWNNTAYVATATDNGNVYTLDVSKTIPPYSNNSNITKFWTFTFSSTNINTTSNIQEIYAPKIDTCNTYNTNWVNYSIKDETDYALINGTIEYVFDYSNGLYSGTLSGNETNDNIFDFCMYPVWANFTTDITLQYSTAVSGYTARDYVKSGYIIDNATSFVDLLLLQGATEITFHVVDDEDTNLQNVFIEVYKYDVPTDSDILVESEYTDSNGEVILNLAKGTTYYSFKFYIGGVLKLQTSRFKLFSTSYEYIIRPASSSPLATWLTLDSEVSRSLTYDNSSKLVNFSWIYSGDAVSRFCLNIDGNGTNWTSSCSSDMTGSLSYTLTSFNISYLANGLAHVNSSVYVLESLTIDTRTSLKDIFGNGLTLFITLIMFLSISLLALVNKSVAVLMGMVAIIVMWMFALIPISWISLIGILFIGMIIMVVMNKR